MPPKQSRRRELEARAIALEAKLAELEPKKFLEILLAFDPTPLPAAITQRRLAAAGGDDAAIYCPPTIPAEKRIGADGRELWVLRCEVTA